MSRINNVGTYLYDCALTADLEHLTLSELAVSETNIYDLGISFRRVRRGTSGLTWGT